MAADTTYSGDVVQIRQDGNLAVPTGKSIDIESGAALKIAGVDKTAALAALSDGELGVLDGVTAGTVTASKAVVVDANKDIAAFRNVTVTNLDAGASGTAGTLDVFPTTASKGKLAITCTNQTGDTTVTLNAAAMAGATTVTIPDPGAAASFLMTEGAQTINGVQTYTLPRVADHNTTITAFATGGQASATALTGEWNNITTCATAGDSVKLPAAVAGQVITIKNNGAASLAVFPATGDAINALAVNLSIDIAVNSEATFRAIDATTWETCEVLTLPSPTTQTGNLVIQAAASAGNTNTTITNASQAAARTYTIPDGGANSFFVLAPAGYKIARNESALDGSNPTTIASGLNTIVSVTATLKGSVAPGVGTCLVTAVISGTDINFYGWKPTGAGDCTLIASTGTESFYWVAVGT